MTETSRASWPAAEVFHDMLDENDASRPSTMETYTTSEETRAPDCEENDAIRVKEIGESLGKQRILRMPELPPEIRET